jgi:fatty acid desaturase
MCVCCSIEYHHIHHLSPLVPMYRLPECHAAGKHLFPDVHRISMLDGLRWLTPMVWDGSKKAFVGV